MWNEGWCCQATITIYVLTSSHILAFDARVTYQKLFHISHLVFWHLHKDINDSISLSSIVKYFIKLNDKATLCTILFQILKIQCSLNRFPIALFFSMYKSVVKRALFLASLGVTSTLRSYTTNSNCQWQIGCIFSYNLCYLEAQRVRERSERKIS